MQPYTVVKTNNVVSNVVCGLCIKNHNRHCKAILVMSASEALFGKAEIRVACDGKCAASLIIENGADIGMASFIMVVGQHRHPERETDPPLV